MKSIGNLPRAILLLEALGFLLFVLAYLNINHYITLPGWLSSPQATIGMIFLAIFMILPAAILFFLRLLQGFSLLRHSSLSWDQESEKKKESGDNTKK